MSEDAQLESDFQEYNDIEKTVKEYNAELRKLRARKKELFENITSYLKDRKLPGFICGNSIVFCDEKPKRQRLKKTDKEVAGLAFLKGKGINADKEFLDQFLDSMKGEKASVTDLKVKNISK